MDNHLQEALHFVANNGHTACARQMARDMRKIERLEAENAELRKVVEAAKEYERVDNTNARLRLRKALDLQQESDD